MRPILVDTATHPKTLFIACGALAKETKTIIDRHRWQVDLKALPALHHMTPPKIVSDLDRLLAKCRADFDRIVVVYGQCGTVNIDDILEKHNVVRVSGPHCYEMFAGADEFEAMMLEEPGTFFLTDWLLRAYDKAVLGGLGLDDHPELTPLYFGNYRRLVYLSQFPNEKLVKKAQTIADSMGWTFEHRYTGMGGLELRLVNLMNHGSEQVQ